MRRPDDTNRDLFRDWVAPQQNPTGAELRDLGMARATDHADAVVPAWSELAKGYLLLFAKRKSDFMTEDCRLYAEANGLPLPPDRRAWGSIAAQAVKSGAIFRVGYAPNKDPKSHKSPKSVWRGM